MSTFENVSRRGFLKGMISGGAFVLGVQFLPRAVWAGAAGAGTSAEQAAFSPNLFVGIQADGTVHIVTHRSEMGTGIRTTLPLVLADELDADWKRVKIEQAIGDARYGSQNTDGSQSIREFFDVMRGAGATARAMLIQAASQTWGVPAAECESDLHVIVHRPSGRRLGYGELALAASKLPVPKKEELQFKPKSAWRYIGKDTTSYDLTDLCTGKAVFGQDARMEGMVYASIEHPPVLGGKVKSLDDKEALKVSGVRRTVLLDPFKPPHLFQPLGGVAVIADHTWAAFQGRSKLKVEWDDGANAAYNSDQYKKQLQETARKPGKTARNVGDVDAAFAQGGKIVEADYYVPHLAHASMEPPAAVAEFRDGKVTAWACTQNPQAVQAAVSQALGIPKEDVTCHVTLLGGGFGRKSKPDYVVEAAVLSKQVGKPVKVIWRREDDIKFDYYHAVAAMYMKAALDPAGRPTAWLQRSVFPPIGSTFAPNQTYGSGGELGMGWTDIPFDIANLRVENGPADAHVRIGWLRSVANIYHAFAVQSFVDELAHAAKRDPLEYQLDLIGKPRTVDLKEARYPNYGGSPESYPVDLGRLRRVTEMAAEKAGWGKRKPGKGWGMGIAAHRSFLAYVATVVEVEVSDKGEVRIPRVETVVDAGLVVNPDNVRAQFEGAAVFGTSIARTGEITATNGRIDQSNFYDYPVARMKEAPFKTNVHIVDSSAPPGGVGEPGVPPFVPALCNAIFAATGNRVRELPLTRAKLGVSGK
ncbi:MAG TPA: molybdopterin cofactor-binding domain-containing protein [Blastocatellia bacterium]|nr:molybdopterin cofactor-binding domain-containing protein [Blastocatellia bacterium]